MAQPVAQRKADHLCVLVHGLWGNPIHMANMAKTLREKHAEDSLHVLVAKRNSGSFTYDGVELGGERVCQEIEEEIEKLAQEGQTITKLSIVGYSLGGLVSRYAVGLLYNRGVFDKVEPVNFTTFATPHLGVRTPLRGWHNNFWNVFGARTLSMSGKQLFIVDDFRGTGRSLLSVLADPDSVFIKGLALFKRRTLYANIINDRTAVYYTTGISKTNPFADLKKIKINYVEGYDDTVLNPTQPIAVAEPEEDHSTFSSRFNANLRSFFKSLPLTVALIIFIPIGAVAFLVNSVFQTIWSNYRIRLHEAGKAGIKVATYRMPLMITGMREAVEQTYENLNSAQDNEYLTSAGEEEAFRSGSASPWRERSQSPLASGSKTGMAANEKSAKFSQGTPSTDSITSLDNAIKSQSRYPDAPTLALTPDQFAMIETLDSVGWRKYPVHIHNDRHSHAAIIIRMNKKSFVEGYSVLRHWLNEEFLMK